MSWGSRNLIQCLTPRATFEVEAILTLVWQQDTPTCLCHQTRSHSKAEAAQGHLYLGFLYKIPLFCMFPWL